MENYIVKTNKVGGKADSWRGQVGYRTADIHKAFKQGRDLECLCAEEWPFKMVIPYADIYKRIEHREPFAANAKYDAYELSYFTWRPNYDGNNLIPEVVVPKQLTLKL